ncbi:MAG: AtpZ/AtpI family protein [Balneola sp.]|nr:MAG: AtpZ/AtpI family protein [Balneola sp.]
MKSKSYRLSERYLPKKYREYIGLGAEIAATLAVPLFVGYLFDQYFGTSPWLLLAGAFVGILLFFNSIFRIARKLNKKE